MGKMDVNISSEGIKSISKGIGSVVETSKKRSKKVVEGVKSKGKKGEAAEGLAQYVKY